MACVVGSVRLWSGVVVWCVFLLSLASLFSHQPCNLAHITRSGEMSKQTFRLDGQTVYYTSPVAVMQVFQAAAAHVELALSAVVIAYCLALFAYLRGVSAAFRDISRVFKSPSKAHKK